MTTPISRPLTVGELAARAAPWWRVPLVAVLGGVLAFLGSYAFSPTYESSTDLLVRARESSVLSSDGQTLSSQPGIVDGSLAVTLGQTQSALLKSTELAEQVVDELALASGPEPDGGLLGPVKDLVAGTVQRTRAYLTHGFYAEPTRREAAITEVQEGLSATPVKDSYVLQVTGSAKQAELSAEVTDAAADALVRISAERFSSEALRNRDFLVEQSVRAGNALTAATAARRSFEQLQGFSDLPADQQLDRTSKEQLSSQMTANEVELRAATAQLASLEESLASTPATSSGRSEIVTGRSSTAVETSSSSSVHEALRIQRDLAQGTVASLTAGQNALRAAIDGDQSSGALLSPEDQAIYQRLIEQTTATEALFQDLGRERQSAELALTRPTNEVTRLDVARVPTFPVGPLRYVYLALGLFCGALGGAALTWLAGRRAPVTAVEEPAGRSHPDSEVAVSMNDLMAGARPDGALGTGRVVRAPAGRFEIYRSDGPVLDLDQP